jgi:hypothetical protein
MISAWLNSHKQDKLDQQVAQLQTDRKNMLTASELAFLFKNSPPVEQVNALIKLLHFMQDKHLDQSVEFNGYMLRWSGGSFDCQTVIK